MNYTGTITDAKLHRMDKPALSYILFTVTNPSEGGETVQYKDDLSNIVEKFGISIDNDNYQYELPNFKGLKCEVRKMDGIYEFVRFVED